MKSRRVPARSPILAPLGCWPHHLQPETLGSKSYSASSALACEEASAQVLGLHIARLTNPPLYRESRWHRGRALLNDLHPLKESGGRRGHVSSSRKVVWARDCPTRRGTNGIVSLSGVRVGFRRFWRRSLDEMKEYEERTPATEKGAVTQTTEASQGLERTDLLLGQLRDLRMGRLPEGLTLEQRAALERIEAALETYKNIMHPPGLRQ
jgi:hypothetical protein